jgi:DNA-binding NtrC family response regulator
VPAGASAEVQRVVRVGETLVVPARDVGPLERRGVRRQGGFVRGPAMQSLLESVAHAAAGGLILHVRGETGTGKEGVAEVFHRAGPRAGRPFVAVNCATIPPNLAERLLFGAKRGAYSGADADAAGYIAEADGGTLFLDEVAELELGVQAKLLRVLESGELLPLGAARGRTVDVRLVSATNQDLRAMVAAGRLREDLYFRIGRPEVALPALRNRPDEIAYLVAEGVERGAPGRATHVTLVEQCLLRPWPGNVRELLVEARAAALAAAAEGSARVTAQHLAATAGTVFAAGHDAAGGAAASGPAPASGTAAGGGADGAMRRRMPRVDEAWRRRIEEALRASGGNVAASARALGLHRNQLRRLLEREGFVGSPDGEAASAAEDALEAEDTDRTDDDTPGGQTPPG